jgi:hypothetical protein
MSNQMATIEAEHSALAGLTTSVINPPVTRNVLAVTRSAGYTNSSNTTAPEQPPAPAPRAHTGKYLANNRTSTPVPPPYSPLCIQCNTRQKHGDHPFCGKTCASQHSPLHSHQTLAHPQGMCAYCGELPKISSTAPFSTLDSYCSKQCCDRDARRRNALNSQQLCEHCGLKPQWFDPKDITEQHQFCGRTCARASGALLHAPPPASHPSSKRVRFAPMVPNPPPGPAPIDEWAGTQLSGQVIPDALRPKFLTEIRGRHPGIVGLMGDNGQPSMTHSIRATIASTAS